MTLLQSYQRNYEYEKLTNFIDSFFTLQTCPAQQIEIMGSALLECEYYKRMVTDTLHRENDFQQII